MWLICSWINFLLGHPLLQKMEQIQSSSWARWYSSLFSYWHSSYNSVQVRILRHHQHPNIQLIHEEAYNKHELYLAQKYVSRYLVDYPKWAGRLCVQIQKWHLVELHSAKHFLLYLRYNWDISQHKLIIHGWRCILLLLQEDC